MVSLCIAEEGADFVDRCRDAQVMTLFQPLDGLKGFDGGKKRQSGLAEPACKQMSDAAAKANAKSLIAALHAAFLFCQALDTCHVRHVLYLQRSHVLPKLRFQFLRQVHDPVDEPK